MDSFKAKKHLNVLDQKFSFWSLESLENQGFKVSKLPFSIRILLENLLRREDGITVVAKDIEALAQWNPNKEPSKEIAFMPSRVVLQDFTGVPLVVDLAAMREAIKKTGGDPKKINPLLPVELVIDHSVQVDHFGTNEAVTKNTQIEFERNQERYRFLKWGQNAFSNFKVVPPSTGIVHQVNLEYLARIVMTQTNSNGNHLAFPDTVIGTDSHTTMINGLGVLGWGVGGIEAEACMLGQPMSMLIPQVVGFRLTGRLAEGATATDLVLTITSILRKKGVVGKFVEFFGNGLEYLPLADRATVANMAPEYGATCGIFPVDQLTLDYLKLTSRSKEQIAIIETYLKEQGLFRTKESPPSEYSDILELDLQTVEPSLAGPKRPQDLVKLGEVKTSFQKAFEHSSSENHVQVSQESQNFSLSHGSVVIAAITSCTNTSNPYVMVAAGLLAKKAVEQGLQTPPWVKTSLAPGSKVVTDYLNSAGLTSYLDQLRFHLVGYGCTTCIGNSGPLSPEISKAIDENNLVAVAVLSGNRNFEGRIHAKVKANYLASPPLVVAYALAGRIGIDFQKEPLGYSRGGKPVYLKDVWPSQKEVAQIVEHHVNSQSFQKSYQNVFEGDQSWRSLSVPSETTYEWDDGSTYIKHPPYFLEMPKEPSPVLDIQNARVLALLSDSITTDHISPAGSIEMEGPAGKYLQSLGVPPKDFNSYGARRGNHEVMMRGTFGNIRLKNLLVPGVEGGKTVHFPDNKQMPIFDAAMEYQRKKVPLLILAGKEYGSGSSRDWAAKGPALLGVKAVIAKSFERIHRTNLVGMGILPLQFKENESVQSLGLTGREVFTIQGLAEGISSQFRKSQLVTVRAKKEDDHEITFEAKARIDTPKEVEYFRHGGILPYVLRQLTK